MLIKMESLKKSMNEVAILRNKVSAIGSKNLALVVDGLTVSLSTSVYSVPEEVFTLLEESMEAKIHEIQGELFAIKNLLRTC